MDKQHIEIHQRGIRVNGVDVPGLILVNSVSVIPIRGTVGPLSRVTVDLLADTVTVAPDAQVHDEPATPRPYEQRADRA